MCADSAGQHPVGQHPVGRNSFVTTCWSIVASAGTADSPEARTALSTLCQAYWTPLYAFARRRGYSAADAADLTQGFFAILIEKEYLNAADRERGRFRTFLITAFQRYLMNEHARAIAQKRGGGNRPVSIDIQDAESRIRIEPIDHQTPERVFERRWAITLLERVLGLLEAEYDARGRSGIFEQCRPCLIGQESSQRYADIAQACGISESAVKVTIHRLRARYRELLRQEVAQTVCLESEVTDELRFLLRAVRN